MRQARTGVVEGIVQGVGFRPFVARLAAQLGLDGDVSNDGHSVRIRVEGDAAMLDAFERRLQSELPPAARIHRARWTATPVRGAAGFHIIQSDAAGRRRLTIPADLKMCGECLAEVRDPTARRYRYPFTNCTQCGPRFTIVTSLPYDRPRTSMAGFAMCDACRREYESPTDRRHHAQPIACARCGPRLALRDASGDALAHGDAALVQAVEALRRGAICALKGLGGHQLLVDARDEGAVQRLRQRKRREEKPFAVLVTDVAHARQLAHLDAIEARALDGPAAPIVLLRRRSDGLAPSVAPGNQRIGLMAPTTPLHELIIRSFEGPLVCTSGNLHGSPIVIDDDAAVAQLGTVADVLLVHDRPIVRRCDDGVVQVVDGGVRTLRLGRGLGPRRMPMPHAGPALVCTGGHLCNAPAIAEDGEAVLWPHVGDLDGLEARRAFAEAVDGAAALLSIDAQHVACDAHPDYATTRWAQASGWRPIPVHHHHAHVATVLAEHGLSEALGIAWDGVGYGADGTAWGGEALHVTPRGARRVAHLRPFALPGGDAAARDGRRAMAGVLAEADLEPPDPELGRYMQLTRSPRLAPRTTSMGRLFDAMAALTGVRAFSAFEGQAAMALEHIAAPGARPYPFGFDGRVVDWRPMLRAALAEREDAPRVASRFHATLTAMVLEIARHHGGGAIVLTGGCFQNALLAATTAAALRERGREPVLPGAAPPGDGGLALGQAWVASHRLAQDGG